MRIDGIRLKNYRLFEEAAFSFGPHFNLLIGDNASGKSAVLDALAVLLDLYVSALTPEGERQVIEDKDVRYRVHLFEGGRPDFQQQHPCSLEVEALVEGIPVHWAAEYVSSYSPEPPFLDSLNAITNAHRSSLMEGAALTLPLIAYYGIGRNFTGSEITPQTLGEFPTRQAGYRNCLSPQADSSLLENWMAEASFVSWQKGADQPAIEGVRTAVVACIEGCRDFYYDASYKQLMLIREKDAVPYRSLSSGFRNTLAIVADMAQRTIRLNPHLHFKAPVETPGIVLIDELDLHLHPQWQRRIVADLRKAFPRIQFIVTTHSPFIIQSMRPGEVIDLMQRETQVPLHTPLAAPAPIHDYADRSIEEITEQVMDVPHVQRSARFEEMEKVVTEYYALIEQGKSASPEERDRIRRRLEEFEMEFSDNPAYVATLKMERLAAGYIEEK